MLPLRYAAPLIAISLALSACSGGGSAGTTPASALPLSSHQVATGTIRIGMPATAGTAAGARKPAYVSPGTTYATLWIDATPTSNTIGVRQACTPGGANGTSGECTINWTSTAGQHNFSAEIDNSTSPSGGGTMLGEISQTYTLTAGANSLPDMLLDGIPAALALTTESLFAPFSPACNGGSINCVSGFLWVLDAAGDAIVPPGYYDSDVCLRPSSNIGFVSLGVDSPGYSCSNGIIASGGYAPFSAYCTGNGNGTFTVTAFGNTPPFVGYLYGAQLAAYDLTYPSQTFPVNGFPTYTCSQGQVISVAGPANGAVTVQSAAKT